MNSDDDNLPWTFTDMIQVWIHSLSKGDKSLVYGDYEAIGLKLDQTDKQLDWATLFTATYHVCRFLHYDKVWPIKFQHWVAMYFAKVAGANIDAFELFTGMIECFPNHYHAQEYSRFYAFLLHNFTSTAFNKGKIGIEKYIRNVYKTVKYSKYRLMQIIKYENNKLQDGKTGTLTVDTTNKPLTLHQILDIIFFNDKNPIATYLDYAAHYVNTLAENLNHDKRHVFCQEWLETMIMYQEYFDIGFNSIEEYNVNNWSINYVILGLLVRFFEEFLYNEMEGQSISQEYSKILSKVMFTYIKAYYARDVNIHILDIYMTPNIFFYQRLCIKLMVHNLLFSNNNDINDLQTAEKYLENKYVCRYFPIDSNDSVLAYSVYFVNGKWGKCDQILDICKREHGQNSSKYQTLCTFEIYRQNLSILNDLKVRWDIVKSTVVPSLAMLGTTVVAEYGCDNDKDIKSIDCPILEMLDNNPTYVQLLNNIASLKQCCWYKCRKKSKKLRKCKACRKLLYCSRLCQKRDWKHSHRQLCCQMSL